MDINLAIERHRKPLARIVATMFAMIGLAEGRPVERLSAPVYRAVLRLLRPAESAVRRLILAAAHGLVLKPPCPRTSRPRVATTVRKAQGRPPFRLFDPRRRSNAFAGYRIPRRRIGLVRGPEPRVRVIDVGFDPRVPLFRKAPAPVPVPPPQPDDSVSASRVSRRLFAVKAALDDLPRQARRYLRWQAKPVAERRPNFSSALRSGNPPGFRKTPIHKVDEILLECDWLARRARLSDTS